jgi:anti-sigma factor RsiW
MTRRHDTGAVPDLVLERHRLGELPRAEAEALERRLGSDPALAARLEALERSDEEIRRRYPPAWLAEQIRSRQEAAPRRGRRRTPFWTRRWPLPAALAATAALVLVVSPRLVSPPVSRPVAAPRPTAAPPAVNAGDRLKGLEPSLVLFRKTDSGSETLADGSVAHPGDVLRIGYRAAGRGHGVILSVDGRGVVTLHLPARGDEAAPLRSAGTVLLDRAYELDDAPRFERFYLVTADRAFEVAPVVEAARRSVGSDAAARPMVLSLPSSLQQTIFTVQKGARP